MNDFEIILNRVVSFHNLLKRKFVAGENLQLVHLEILTYLSICNKVSNTTTCLSLYLGQTKGSVSQSIDYLEREKLISIKQNTTDKRLFHLSLTSRGRLIVQKWKKFLDLQTQVKEDTIENLRNLLVGWKMNESIKTFGLCKTCKFNIKLPNNKFKCGLLGIELERKETEKICREHQTG
ncbi:MAG: MarR family winged helix-turn-helix transcriptional regulator [Leptospiraceae bacterium]|nr:MarR family winged helix-turn-helix transcriptional regulator [Leptospiraceae bacterium]